jgi:polycomb protein EED
LAGAAKENHNSELYSIAWSSDLFLKSLDKPPDESGDCVGTMSGFVRCFATCGGNNLTLYEVEVHNSDRHGSLSCTTSPCSGFSSRQVYVDADENEDYYTCVFAGRGVGSPLSYGPLRRQENATVVIDSNTDHAEDEAKRGHLDEIRLQWNNYSDRDGPQLLLVAGEQGIIKVVDIIHRRLHLTLSGHGDAIYDLKVNPQNSWLLISASKDESIRLWNIMNATCIGIFSGHEGHKSSVLSVSWHPMGKMFVSSSMDATIKIWSLEVPHVQENVRKCLSISPKARIYRGRSDESHTTVQPVIEQLPIYSTTKMHLDYSTFNDQLALNAVSWLHRM